MIILESYLHPKLFKMKILHSFTIFIITSLTVFSQSFSSTDPSYIDNVRLGEAALNNMKYDSCMMYYKTAFEIKQTSFMSTMRAAACGYSAFDVDYLDRELAKAFDINWGGSKQVFDSNEEFEYLRGTAFEDMVINAYEDALDASGVDIVLMEEFENIRFEDQRYRQQMRDVSQQYGNQSPQMDSLWQLQSAADSVNTIRIVEIFEEKGYPGKSMVGPGQASTAFLVIQHADLEVQEKYLSLITDAADDGEVNWSSVALLIDRVNLRNEKPQIYGSQVSSDPDTGESFFSEIAEPYKVDSLRAEVGLGPLNDYAKFFEFEWDVEKHVARHSKKKDKD